MNYEQLCILLAATTETVETVEVKSVFVKKKTKIGKPSLDELVHMHTSDIYLVLCQ